MKTLLFFIVFISGTALAQTNVIAAKSHSSTKTIDKNDLDNFGNPPERPIFQRVVEKVIYLENECIVELYQPLDYTSENQKKAMDTICNHPFLQQGQVDIKRIKAMYPSNTEFIDFEKIEGISEKDLRQLKKKKEQKKSSALPILLIGCTLFFLYSSISTARLTNAKS